MVLFSALRPPKSSVSVSILLERLPLCFFPFSRRARRYARGTSGVRLHTRNASDWHSLSLVYLVSILVARLSASLRVLLQIVRKEKRIVPNCRVAQANLYALASNLSCTCKGNCPKFKTLFSELSYLVSFCSHHYRKSPSSYSDFLNQTST